MAYYTHQADFSKGQITHLLGSRSNVDFWQQSLFECVNFHVLTHGGLRRRSGTKYVATVANSAVLARLFPFKFSESQSYVLVLNDGKMRFAAQRGIVGSPYEINHPFAAVDLDRLTYTQFNDVAYFAHKGYAPRKLSRLADTNWTLGQSVFRDGPYLNIATTATTNLRPSASGAIHPAMTSNTAPSGTAVSSPVSVNAFKVFDQNSSSAYYDGTGNVGSITFTPPTSKVCDAYWIRAVSNTDPSATPVSWSFQGLSGGSWITLDTRQGESGFQRGDVRFYSFNNDVAYSAYRFEWTGTNFYGATESSIAEMGWHESGDTQTPFALTAVTTAGINGGAGFLASDVGRSIRLQGSDGYWRWARIASRTSATVVNIRLYGHALPDLSLITNWQLGAFSATSGYPACVTLYDERLMWARTNAEPVTVYGSKQGNFDEYGSSNPPVGTDGIKITLLSSNMNEIVWLADDKDLVTGSAGQIRSVAPADITQAFSATNISQIKGPTSGADHLRPLSIGGVTLYAGAGATKIRELVLGDQNRYVAPELSLLGEHFFKSGIVDWAFAERPDPTIYCVMGNGELVSVTYDREQRVVGFARHAISKGFVESVAVIPGIEIGFDDVYLIVRRTIDGTSRRYVEVMERPFDGDIDTVEDAFHVDCGLSYSGSPITTVTGLSHLEGETVVVLADGSVVNDLVVTGGQVTLPYSASKISVGLRFKSRAVTLPISGPQQDGTLFGRRRTVVAASIDILNSGAAKAGLYGSADYVPDLFETVLKTGDELFGNPVELVTGFYPCEVEGSWTEGGGKLIFETDEPLPLLVRSLVLQTEGEP